MQDRDVGKSIEYLQINKKKGDTRKGQCAKYINNSLKEGHIFIRQVVPRYPPTPSACDYGPYLQEVGFRVHYDTHDSGGMCYKAQAGDIVIFDPYEGQKPHEHGHIQMFDGLVWISDFQQKDFFPGGDARSVLPEFRVFRYSGLSCDIAQYMPAPKLAP